MPNQDSTQDPQNTPLGHSSDDQPVIIPSDSPVIPPVAPLPPAIEPPITQPPISTPTTKEQVPTSVQEPSVPSFLNSTDLPPLTPDFQSVTDNTNVTKTNSGSNAPLPDLPMTTGSPKKKFGGGKIIATILGLFLLVGGIAGGVILTQQNQNLSEKASVTDDNRGGGGGGGGGRGGGGGGGTCSSGQTRCSGNEVEVCSGGEWRYSNTCSNGCAGGSCIAPPPPPTCSSGSRCNGGNVEVCLQGEWRPGATCSNGCAGGNCIPEACTNGAKICAGDNLKVCSGGVWGAGSPCPYGCSNNECTPLPPNSSCGRNVDTGAPRCCTTAEIAACGNNFVCEPGGTNGPRKECITSSGHCTVAAAGASGSEACGGSGNNTPPPDETPPPGSPTAQCQNIKAYSATWALLTNAQLAALTPTTVVNFCVLGTASEGTFDRAKFTINSVAQSETTTKRPTTNDYCQSYTIPTGVTSFNITALIHHATLGWK